MSATAQDKAQAVNDYRAHTIGSEDIHQHWLGLRYTDGLNYVAETCGAHWLIDLVASHQPKLRREPFQLWRLVRHKTRTRPEGWDAEAWTDSPEAEGSRRLVLQRISYSDFPEELSPFEFYVEYGTAMLKEER